jgi:hypothetical protein
MTEHVARCNSGIDDTITARRDSGTVELRAAKHGERVMEAYLYPADARTFARGILALADEVEGGEGEAEPAPVRLPQVGDRVRIVRNGYASEGSEHVGTVGTVKEVDPRSARARYRVSLPDDDYGWYCAEVELVDEAPESAVKSPAEPATDAPTPSPRARYIDEARALFGDTYFEADGLIRLAQFLADGE